MIRFACPHCKKQFQGADTLAGATTTCPNCNEAFSIPRQSATSIPRTSSQTNLKSSGSRDEAEEQTGISAATKIVAAVGAIVGLAAIGALITFVVSHDSWEAYNLTRVSTELDRASQLHSSDPLKAYKLFDSIIEEAKSHRITDEQLIAKLTRAEKSRSELHELVQQQLKTEQAEKVRLANEEKRRADEAEKRTAEEAEKKRIADEARKVAEEKERIEDEKRKKAVSRYSNAPQSTRAALNVVKKVEARTEIGINYRDYSTIVGEAWAEVKVFVESPDGKNVPELCEQLVKSVERYKLALNIWNDKIQYPRVYSNHAEVDVMLQQCWSQAGLRIKVADALLNTETTYKALKSVNQLQKSEDDSDATWKKFEAKLLNVKSDSDSN